jgi:hypothetical protein
MTDPMVTEGTIRVVAAALSSDRLTVAVTTNGGRTQSAIETRPDNNEMKLTRSATVRMPRPLQLISVFYGQLDERSGRLAS